jgi:Domain of unknown function DUF29
MISCRRAVGIHRKIAMATQVRPKAKQLYDEDFYVWTEAQAELLRKRQFEALDLDHLIEEVKGLGDAKTSAVLNNASVIIEHLLKFQFNPAEDPRRGCAESIVEHRPARDRTHAVAA